MTEEYHQLLMLRGLVSTMPQEEQDKIKKAIENVKNAAASAGQLAGVVIAIAALEVSESNQKP